MSAFFNKKILSPFAAVLLCIVVAAVAVLVTYFASTASRGGQGDLYAAAVEDSIVAEEDEILPLVSLTNGSPMATFDGDGRVLLLSWNDTPELYAEGSTLTLGGEIWTFTDGEISEWFAENSDGVSDWELRLKQLIGLPESSAYTHVTAFWADLEDVIRPAYQTDPAEQMSAELLNGSALGEHEEWFNGNIVFSYFTSAYPWTRLGYTYDWSGENGEYGLSEFLILGGAEVEIAYTITTEQFIQQLEENL